MMVGFSHISGLICSLCVEAPRYTLIYYMSTLEPEVAEFYVLLFILIKSGVLLYKKLSRRTLDYAWARHREPLMRIVLRYS